eukprot:TRINITY_DN20289_c0_g2_i4.p1 TRINITY_DN20289_c0_g2~~TRINITY_DN20289_c0_g2_i4.p1  ORF type:complete len:319 (-),score=70.90 TRINITY_DN20289_c0_g2_i4:352-1308(-)
MAHFVASEASGEAVFDALAADALRPKPEEEQQTTPSVDDMLVSIRFEAEYFLASTVSDSDWLDFLGLLQLAAVKFGGSVGSLLRPSDALDLRPLGTVRPNVAAMQKAARQSAHRPAAAMQSSQPLAKCDAPLPLWRMPLRPGDGSLTSPASETAFWRQLGAPAQLHSGNAAGAFTPEAAAQSAFGAGDFEGGSGLPVAVTEPMLQPWQPHYAFLAARSRHKTRMQAARGETLHASTYGHGCGSSSMYLQSTLAAAVQLLRNEPAANFAEAFQGGCFDESSPICSSTVFPAAASPSSAGGWSPDPSPVARVTPMHVLVA